jgi:hypothetical protein
MKIQFKTMRRKQVIKKIKISILKQTISILLTFLLKILMAL